MLIMQYFEPYLFADSYFLTIGNGSWSESLKVWVSFCMLLVQVLKMLSSLFTLRKYSFIYHYSSQNYHFSYNTLRYFRQKSYELQHGWSSLSQSYMAAGHSSVVSSTVYLSRPFGVIRLRGSVFHLMRFLTANIVFNVVTDLLVYILPLTGLKRLMLPKSQKIGLFLVFTFGGL